MSRRERRNIDIFRRAGSVQPFLELTQQGAGLLVLAQFDDRLGGILVV